MDNAPSNNEASSGTSALDDGLGVESRTALQQFHKYGGDEELDPVEQLRFFCSLAMTGQDWLDVEPFFDNVVAAMPPPNVEAQGGAEALFGDSPGAEGSTP